MSREHEHAGFYVANWRHRRICYAYHLTTHQRFTITPSLDQIAWVAVRGLDIALRSGKRQEPLVLWKFGTRVVKQINSLPMTGPLRFHPTLDIISIYHLKKTAEEQYVGTWADVEFGTKSSFTIPPEEHISFLCRRTRLDDHAIEPDEFDTAASGTVLVDCLGDTAYPIFDNRFFGLRPVWGPSKQVLMKYYENQVAFVCRDMVYIACGDPNSSEPILFQDMSKPGQAVIAELSQIRHAPVQSERAGGVNANFIDATIFRAPLLGDGTFMVQIGFTHIHVWCFDEDVPLANEVLAYRDKAKMWAGDRALERQWKIYKGEMRGLARPVIRLLSPRSMVDLGSASTPPTSKGEISSIALGPDELLGNTSLRDTSSSVVTDDQKAITGHQVLLNKENDQRAEKVQAPGKLAKKHSMFRRGIYKLVIRVVGRLL